MNTIAQAAAYRIIPVIVIDDAAGANALGDGLVAGGLPVAEVTLRTPAAAASIRALAERGDILVGAGTVLTAEQVDIAADAGARFAVSPGLSEQVATRCRARGLALLPGAVTATEVQRAAELGFDTVKFFPAETSGGAKAIAALTAPFAGMRFIPTGGISPSNLEAYLSVPGIVAAGGSWMVPQAAIAARDTATITALCTEATTLAATITLR